MLHSPGHPGWLLAEELETRKISASRAARDLGVSRQTISRVISLNFQTNPSVLWP